MWPFGKREEQRSEQRAITEWPWDTGGPIPGGNINVDKALTLVPVFGAARMLADTVASLTPVLYTRDKSGLQRQLPTPSLFANPSIHGTIVDWLHRGTTSMALQGDAIGLITDRDYYNFPTMVEWLNPDQVQVLDGSLSGQGSFMNPIWLWNGRRMDPRNILHIPWFTVPWKVRGLSPIGAFKVTANVGLGAQDYAAEWFNNGGVPPGTFRNSQQKVAKEDADILTARITKRLKTRQPLVYGNDWEYTPIAIKPNEAQFIECAVGSTMFSMADGTLRRADELHPGNRVVSWDGTGLISAPISSVVEMPSGPTVRVVTQCGRELTTSPQHPYLAAHRPRTAGKRYKGTLDDNQRWITAEGLRVGDYVRVESDWDGESDYGVDVETGWALGALIGDGYLPARGRAVKFTTSESNLVDRLAKWLSRYDATMVPSGNRPYDYVVRTGGVGRREGAIRTELRNLGVLGHGAADKGVPEAVLRSGPKTWAAFLAGYLDTDGTVVAETRPQPIVIWSSISRRLLVESQHLLALLGVKASIRLHVPAERRMVVGQECDVQATWTLTVCGRANVSRLANLLDVAHPVKAQRLAAWATADGRDNGARSEARWTRIVAVEDAGQQVTYGVTVANTHTHVTGGLITHNTARLTATQIAVIYGLPPDKIGGSTGDGLTYSTVEMNTLDYLTFSARPWLVKWEQALNRCFPRGQYVKFETSEMLRTDVKTRAMVDRMSLGPTIPWKTQDEVRAKRDLPPMPKDDPLSAWQIAKSQKQSQPTNGQPPQNGKSVQDGKPPSNGSKPKATETKSISGSSAVVYLRARVPQSNNPWPILKPPPAANGTKPLAVGRN